MSTEPSSFGRRSIREERSAIFWSFRISARVSASYTVTDQNSLIGGFGGTRRRYERPPSNHSPALSFVGPEIRRRRARTFGRHRRPGANCLVEPRGAFVEQVPERFGIVGVEPQCE